MSEERKLRSLEGLGYVAAFMIGVGGITEVKALDYFNALGLVFAIVVIVRLMVMSIEMRVVQTMYDLPDNGELEVDEASAEQEGAQG